MPKAAQSCRLLLALSPDPNAAAGLSRQIASALRRAVLNRQCPPGSRLPSTRGLASELGVSRNTVLDAYSQLLAEGYLEGRSGSGTFVSDALPEDSLRARTGGVRSAPRTPSALLSSRGARIAEAHRTTSGDALRPFNPGFPQLDPALFATWWRIASRVGRQTSAEMLNYGDPAGYGPLREAIAAHIGTARGVRCSADQVIVTTGTQQGLALACRLLLEPGDIAWMEDPGYAGAVAAIQSAAARVAAVPVDDEGLDVDVGIEHAASGRLAYVSASHQYPLGVTMTLRRRLRLLEWAAHSGAWILEDDYDSEFRHGERPLPTLQGLDAAARVIYVGTFSKVLFPAVRLGYMVVPRELVAPFRQAQRVLGNQPATAGQATLAAFIAEGHFIRHVRRMRRVYQDLRSVLNRAIGARIGSSLTLTGAEVGLHAVARFAVGIDDRQVSRCAAAAGVDVAPLSNYYIGTPKLSGLVLGYGHLDAASIEAGVDVLAAAIRTARTASPSVLSEPVRTRGDSVSGSPGCS